MGGVPNTLNGLSPYDCVSALQKHIRRSEETQAYLVACEMLNSSGNLPQWMLGRLLVISHEDIDAVASPHVVPFVAASVAQATEWVRKKKKGEAALAVANAIRVLCHAKKSRVADHWAMIWYERNAQGARIPEIPDYAYDMHTRRGKEMGRGLDHFYEEAAKLFDVDGTEVSPDPWRDEARQADTEAANPPSLFPPQKESDQ